MLAENVIETRSEHGAFGGVQGFYRHHSRITGVPMRFSLFQPPARGRTRALLVFLAGLTCTEETFAVKAQAQRRAAELGITLLAPDTSPRDTQIPGESDDWEAGAGAGFYLNATESPWSSHFRMDDYIVEELVALVLAHWDLSAAHVGIFGHSMGGHGALVLALRNPGMFRSVSAFAPVAAPVNCPWGQKAFAKFLGDDKRAWQGYDASALMAAEQRAPYPGGILVDQGLDDRFLAQGQLQPELFEQACAAVGQPLSMRRHAGYDHGYYFIASFMDDHLAHHAQAFEQRG